MRRTPGRRSTPSRSRCSARTRRSAASGTWWSLPVYRKDCGPTRFRAGEYSAHSVCWMCSTALPRTRRCAAPLLAEERRLLVAAMGRARTRLLVTAIDGEAKRRQRRQHALAVLRRDRAVVYRTRRRRARAGHGAAGAVGRRGGRPAARRGVRAARHGQRRDARLRGNAIGSPGRRRGAGCRTGRLVWHVTGQHHRTDVERRRSRRHAHAVEPADVDRLPVALVGRAARGHRSPRPGLDDRFGAACADRPGRPAASPNCWPRWSGHGSICHSNRSGIRPTSWPGIE